MNRRDILKAVAVAPFLGVIGNIRKQDASATTVEKAYTVKTNRVFGITGHYTENHHWTAPTGEHMKVEHLARVYDSYDYYFAVYPKVWNAGDRVYYARFSMSPEVYEDMPETAQRLYERAVSNALDGYYAGDWSRHDPTLSIEGA